MVMLAVLHTTPSATIVAGKATGRTARRATTRAALHHKEEEARLGDEEVEEHRGKASAGTIRTKTALDLHSHPPKQCSEERGMLG